MTRISQISFVFILCFIWQQAGAQCGTKIPKSHLKSPPLMHSTSKTVTEYDLNKTLSVHIYIVASGFNIYNYSAADYQPNWDVLNEIFEPINLQFAICGETLIPNYNYNVLSREPDPETGLTEEDEMMAQYYIPNVINVYYIQDLLNEPEVDGYAYFPGGPDIIVLRKEHGESTIPHEMGHFFGLYHTFETELGVELCNGSNCEVAGDLVCDTPADNNGNTADCQYDDLSTDSNGDFYTPYTSNIMSYYTECSCKFTPQQYNRMAWMYLNERNYLW